MSLDTSTRVQNLHLQLVFFEHIVNEILVGKYETINSVRISLAQIISWEFKQIFDGLGRSMKGHDNPDNPDIISLLDEYTAINKILTTALQEVPIDMMISFFVKDIEKKLLRYEARVERVDRAEYEVNLDTLQVRDGIEFLLQKLSKQIDVTPYKQRLVVADQVLKMNYLRNPENLDSFTIGFRERTFKPNALWWWYMDINSTPQLNG